jgi:hypothetical protein
MDDTILKHLEVEAASLEAKLTAIRGVIAVYRGDSAPRTTAAVRAQSPSRVFASSGPMAVKLGHERPSGLKDAVLRVAREVIATSSVLPVSTREIMDALETEGIQIAGEKPQNGVSSILSRADDIISNGRAGWTLKSQMFGSEAGASKENETSGNPFEEPDVSDAGKDSAPPPSDPFTSNPSPTRSTS